MKGKYIWKNYFEKIKGFSVKISALPQSDLALAVVIPAYCEKELLGSLRSLADCLSPEDGSVEVIVVLNSAVEAESDIKEFHRKQKIELEQWATDNSPKWMKHHFLLEENMPVKHAGVGLARKIGMDEAAYRLLSVDKPEAPIVCLDADSKCEVNYLRTIRDHFNENPLSPACSIYFEHETNGSEYNNEVYKAIKYYELHLRYYKQGLSYAMAPFAFHTIGSSMAVRAIDYCRQGGMNRRKAGEDFYFLQKYIELGNFSEIYNTTVVPSPRSSTRVPFGTGRAVLQQLTGEKSVELTYSIDSFIILKSFFENPPISYMEEKIDPPKQVMDFIGGKEIFSKNLQEIYRQSSGEQMFEKRFFRWFNAFKTLKFIHFLRDSGVGEMNLLEAAHNLEMLMEINSPDVTIDGLLGRYRERDRKLILG